MAVRHHDNFRRVLDAGVRAVPVEYNGGEVFALRNSTRSDRVSRAVDVLISPLLEASRSDRHVNLRGIAASDLTHYFTNDSASVFVDANRGVAIGYARLKARLTDVDDHGEQGMKQRLRITIPETIYELGTVIVNGTRTDGTAYRSNGLASKLIGDLVGMSDIKPGEGRTLIIATMKEVRTMRAFRRAFVEAGFSDPQFSNHLDYINIARLTCTCMGSFGSGFQIAPAADCPERIPRNEDQVRALGALNRGDLQRDSVEERTLNDRCVMFVSEAHLARRIDGGIDTSGMEAR